MEPEPSELHNIYAKLAAALSGVVAFGFIAWAGVVWQSSEKLTVVLAGLHTDVREMRIRQDYLVERVQELEDVFKRRMYQPSNK